MVTKNIYGTRQKYNLHTLDLHECFLFLQYYFLHAFWTEMSTLMFTETMVIMFYPNSPKTKHVHFIII